MVASVGLIIVLIILVIYTLNVVHVELYTMEIFSIYCRIKERFSTPEIVTSTSIMWEKIKEIECLILKNGEITISIPINGKIKIHENGLTHLTQKMNKHHMYIDVMHGKIIAKAKSYEDLIKHLYETMILLKAKDIRKLEFQEMENYVYGY